jgi:hypothetical protein
MGIKPSWQAQNNAGWPNCLVSLSALSACVPCQPVCLVNLPALSACVPCQPVWHVSLPALSACLPFQPACLVSLSACLSCQPVCHVGLSTLFCAHYMCLLFKLIFVVTTNMTYNKNKISCTHQESVYINEMSMGRRVYHLSILV